MNEITNAAELDALTDLAVRLNRANKGLLSQARTDIDSERRRLEGKAEGVRLALSYVEEALRARPDQPRPVKPSREDVARTLHIFTRRGLGHEYRDIPACIASLTNTGASCLQFTHRAADAVLALLPGRCAPTEDEVLGALFPDGVGFPWIPYERKKAAAVRALYAGQPTVREAKAEALEEARAAHIRGAGQ